MSAGSVSFLTNTPMTEMAVDDSQFTFGTSAPGAGDFEFRWSLNPTAGNTAYVITRLDIIKALHTLLILFESNARYTTLSEQ